ncbi:MAG: hypothetical protein LBU90_03680 [Bacteroidales bacterium]|jgi:hypothetical protein|nr:hypothetical protein [Bacteroidales bacterium]
MSFDYETTINPQTGLLDIVGGDTAAQNNSTPPLAIEGSGHVIVELGELKRENPEEFAKYEANEWGNEYKKWLSISRNGLHLKRENGFDILQVRNNELIVYNHEQRTYGYPFQFFRLTDRNCLYKNYNGTFSEQGSANAINLRINADNHYFLTGQSFIHSAKETDDDNLMEETMSLFMDGETPKIKVRTWNKIKTISLGGEQTCISNGSSAPIESFPFALCEGAQNFNPGFVGVMVIPAVDTTVKQAQICVQTNHTGGNFRVAIYDWNMTFVRKTLIGYLSRSEPCAITADFEDEVLLYAEQKYYAVLFIDHTSARYLAAKRIKSEIPNSTNVLQTVIAGSEIAPPTAYGGGTMNLQSYIAQSFPGTVQQFDVPYIRIF